MISVQSVQRDRSAQSFVSAYIHHNDTLLTLSAVSQVGTIELMEVEL